MVIEADGFAVAQSVSELGRTVSSKSDAIGSSESDKMVSDFLGIRYGRFLGNRVKCDKLLKVGVF